MTEFSHPRPKLISFFMCNCPRCGADKVFRYSPINLKHFTDTKDSCKNCGLDYNPEPGFFFGAMYWSYAILVAMIVTLSIVFNVMDIFDYAIYAIPVFIIILLPFIFRYSRMLMLYVVYPVMYKGKFDKE
ncbi:MAG: DUF983 domain-containing protein [Bacteroidetes bacterium]|nr:DUF983 domain-containing protein [Bacteroidota bacterium]